MSSTARWIACLSFVALLCGPAPAHAQHRAKPKVYVIFWFDTEDYLLPASDDAALRVADFLSRQGIRATFKVVGEKARTLQSRRRNDVIAALKKHEIGFHSNWHSTQPTPAMYASNLGWDEGVAEFERREGPGARDVERIFGVRPSCYGQPGSSWCPQSYGALKKWGMVYLDAGSHVALEGRPCFYAGVFNLYHLTHTIRADLNKPDELEKANARFALARKQLLAEGGGVVSIVYHPCEWVHKKFWDGVNFAKGANPPRAAWKLPPQKTAEETKLSYRIFADYVAFMKRFDDVQFVTASEAARLYADRARKRRFGLAELKKIAVAVGDEVGFQKHGEYALAASEVFDLLNRYVAGQTAGKKVESVELEDTPLGPTSLVARMTEEVTTDDSQFTRTCADVAEYVRKHGRLPGAVWLGSTAVSPEAYLKALAKVALELLPGRPVPAKIELAPAKLGVARYVSEDRAELWGWVIFPPGFRAPAMMDLARRQAWTLKPALLHAPNDSHEKPKEAQKGGHAEPPSEVAATFKGHRNTITCLAFSPDGKTLASGSKDGNVILWEVATGKARVTLPGHKDMATAVAFSPNGKALASASHDSAINLWDADTGQRLSTLRGHHRDVRGLTFSPDGKLLASVGVDKDVRLWDWAAGTLSRVLTGHGAEVNCVRFSPDGKTLATGGWDRTIRLWALATGKCQRVLGGHTGFVRDLAFAENAKALLSSGKDGVIRTWDVASGQARAHLGKQDGLIRSLALSPDGKLLASAGRDGKLNLWDMGSGKVLAAMDEGVLGFQVVAFQPGGKVLATGGIDRKVTLWHVARVLKRHAVK
jgi:WD40 repeat protein